MFVVVNTGNVLPWWRLGVPGPFLDIMVTHDNLQKAVNLAAEFGTPDWDTLDAVRVSFGLNHFYGWALPDEQVNNILLGLARMGGDKKTLYTVARFANVNLIPTN